MEKQSTSLHRSLTLYHIVLFGLAYLTPMIVYGIFGIIAQTSQGLVASSYLVAMIAMLFTAYSYGQMVKAFPVSGSAYTYTRKAISSHLGFLIGWAVLLDYLFIPMAIWLIGGAYLVAAFPAVPIWIWIILFIFVTTFINIVGIKITTNVNKLMMVFQFLVIGIFILLCVRDVLRGAGTGGIVSIAPFVNGEVPFSAVLAGASIACYSFLGFDAVTTFTEETKEPEKTMPKAILFITLIGGAIFIVASYFAQLVFPDFNRFQDISSAGFEIARLVGGNLFSAIFLAGMIIAQFASGLSAQASASRLLFAMGRDSVLPKKICGFIHPKFQTPVYNLMLIGIVALLALKLDVTTSTSFINFGAFAAFTFVNLSVIAHYFIKEKRRTITDSFLYGLIPLIGAGFDFWLLLNLDKDALILGSLWSLCGIIYLVVLTKGLKKRPPEFDFEQAENADSLTINS